MTFDIDANGIVNVGAKNKATNKEQSIRIQANGGLSDADIDKMLKDAEAHKAEDEKRKHIVEARNHADATLDSSEKALAEHGDKVPAPIKAAAESALVDLKAVKNGDDLEAIRAKTQTLVEASMKFGEAMYATQQSDAASGSKPADDGVFDAEFEAA